MASALVTETSVYECVGHPSKNDVKTIINVLLNENFTVASQSKITSIENQILMDFSLALSTLKTTKGYALADILTELHRYVHKSN
jgi:replication factor C subunit 3/5